MLLYVTFHNTQICVTYIHKLPLVSLHTLEMWMTIPHPNLIYTINIININQGRWWKFMKSSHTHLNYGHVINSNFSHISKYYDVIVDEMCSFILTFIWYSYHNLSNIYNHNPSRKITQFFKCVYTNQLLSTNNLWSEIIWNFHTITTR